MSELNAKIRNFLQGTCQEQQHPSCFSWNNLIVRLDPVYIGESAPEHLFVNIYDPTTDTAMNFNVHIGKVNFDENVRFGKLRVQTP